MLYFTKKTKRFSMEAEGQATMFRAFPGNLRGSDRKGFILKRAVFALLLALLLPLIASAYTVVLKGGRRIEIPSNFIVTPLTLTYEAAPGLNVTLQMSVIDIPATERANNEPAGSLLKRAEQKLEGATAITQSRRERKPLTQADIEKARIARQQSEEAYERRRQELGQPTLEESRRRAEEEAKKLSEESKQYQAERSQSESYWRARANELRNETASLDRQINYFRARLAEMPDYSTLNSYGFATGFTPIVSLQPVVTRFPVIAGHPGFMHGINGTSAPTAGFQAFGGFAPQSQNQKRAGAVRGNFNRRVITRTGTLAIVAPLYSASSAGYDNYSYDERADLVSHLHELEAQRAGLEARWSSLEEEARRAGASIGWLRP
ncbi:MAG: hypothetical protein DMF68_06650 [Acidobacteria bacterium]|nr:MAG: hypothetical protein DMF68_06650 [Acidobacteriota bacterium]